MSHYNVDEFTRAYMECALWSTNDESTTDGGVPMDTNYSIEDIEEQTLAKMLSDCNRFQLHYGCLVEAETMGVSNWKRAGHDFWLTRNNHGAGFWDGDWPRGDALTRICTDVFGEFLLYVSDDGKIMHY